MKDSLIGIMIEELPAYDPEDGGAQFVRLTGMDDNVDLYIYGAADFSSNLQCSSTNAGTTDESCIAGCSNCPNDTRYVVVDGANTSGGALFTIEG